MHVIAFFKGLGGEGNLAEEGQGKELPVLHSAFLRVVEPVLRKSGTYDLATAHVVDCRFVRELPRHC